LPEREKADRLAVNLLRDPADRRVIHGERTEGSHPGGNDDEAFRRRHSPCLDRGQWRRHAVGAVQIEIRDARVVGRDLVADRAVLDRQQQAAMKALI
jgi:hypothetical protein